MNWRRIALVSAVLAAHVFAGSAFARQTAGHREQVVRFCDEVWNKGNLAYIDQAMDPEFVRFGHAAEGNTVGIAALKERVQQIRSAFTDYNVTVLDMVGVRDKAVFSWRLRGNYVGPEKQFSPGRTVDLTGKTVWLFRGNKVVKEIVEIDPEEYYRQIQMAVPYSQVENRALVLSYLYEVMSSGNVSALDELVAPTHVLHDINNRTIKGIDALRAHVLDMRKAFPDLKIEVNDLIAYGNVVTARWTISATHSGEWNGFAPSNLRIVTTGMSLTHIKDGKMQETWSDWDTMALQSKSTKH